MKNHKRYNNFKKSTCTRPGLYETNSMQFMTVSIETKNMPLQTKKESAVVRKWKINSTLIVIFQILRYNIFIQLLTIPRISFWYCDMSILMSLNFCFSVLFIFLQFLHHFLPINFFFRVMHLFLANEKFRVHWLFCSRTFHISVLGR